MYRGCAHCGRGGAPSLGDGGYETRFERMNFVNSSQRALFRHPNEAFFYDLDGTLTDTQVKENYTLNGKIRGSSMVGTSVLLPRTCIETEMATMGSGGSICKGFIFKRVWHKIADPSIWVGKALCVRPPWVDVVNRCQGLKPICNCLPYLLMAGFGNVFLAAEGIRYNLQVKCN
jgi:hypothetical protein